MLWCLEGGGGGQRNMLVVIFKQASPKNEAGMQLLNVFTQTIHVTGSR